MRNYNICVYIASTGILATNYHRLTGKLGFPKLLLLVESRTEHSLYITGEEIIRGELEGGQQVVSSAAPDWLYSHRVKRRTLPTRPPSLPILQMAHKSRLSAAMMSGRTVARMYATTTAPSLNNRPPLGKRFVIPTWEVYQP